MRSYDIENQANISETREHDLSSNYEWAVTSNLDSDDSLELDQVDILVADAEVLPRPLFSP